MKFKFVTRHLASESGVGMYHGNFCSTFGYINSMNHIFFPSLNYIGNFFYKHFFPSLNCRDCFLQTLTNTVSHAVTGETEIKFGQYDLYVFFFIVVL